MNDRVYRELFEASPAGLMLCGGDGEVFLSNAAAASLLMVNGDILPGSSMLEYFAPEHRDTVRAYVAGLAAGTGVAGACLAAPQNSMPGKRTLRITGNLTGAGVEGNVAPRVLVALNDISREIGRASCRERV